MTEPQPAGIDMARRALAQAREASRKRGQQTAKTKPQKRVRATYGSGRDPISAKTAVERMAEEYGWNLPSAGARIVISWAELVPEIAGLAVPERYDEETRTLHVRPVSHAAAAQVRLHAARLVAVLTERTGAETVAAVRVLPPGPGPAGAPTPAATGTSRRPEPAPPKTKADASPGLLAAQAIVAEHRAQDLADPDQAVRDKYFGDVRGTLREARRDFTDAEVLREDLEEQAARDADVHERARKMARAQKAGRAPAVPRAFQRTA